MRIKYKRLISCITIIIAGILLIVTAPLLVHATMSQSQSTEYLPEEFIDVYTRLYSIENMNPLIKPNTSIPVELLKEALEYVYSNKTLALEILSEANKSINRVLEAYNAILFATYIRIIMFFVAIILLVITYKRFLKRRIFSYWLKARSKNIVIKGDGKPRSILFSREAIAVILAIMTVATVIVTVESFRPVIREHYSQLGLVGEKGILGNYNIVRPIGDNITFRVFIGNMLGYTALYEVKIYIMINNKSRNLYSKYLVLGDGENVTIPFTLKINDTGPQNVIVELWIYNPDTKSFVYHERRVNIWVKGVKV